MKNEDNYFGPILNNKQLVLLYRKFFRKDVPFWFRKRSILLLIWIPIRKFINVVIIPNIPFNKLRILLYRMIGYKIGKNVFIGMKCYLDDVKPNLLFIEDNVVISYSCIFAVHGKTRDSWSNQPIIIKKGVYVGAGAIILSGVTIGENATVAAGSVLTKDVDDNIIVAGVPAKKI